jgi:4'-phosphopantetheinyl transferase
MKGYEQSEWFEYYYSKLNAHYKNKIKSLLRWQDRQVSLLAIFILIEKVCNGDWSYLNHIQYNNFGKPFIKGIPFFNISHTQDLAVVLTSESAEIGIDVELIQNIDIFEFRNVFNEEEYKYVESDTSLFFDYWTKKEAVLKAKGVGMTIDLAKVNVTRDSCIVEGVEFFMKNVYIRKEYCCWIAQQLKQIQYIKVEEIFLR